MVAGLPKVLVVGGGELGSAVCHRLQRSGIKVFLVDLEKPYCIRRNVCFAMACYDGTKEVEGVRAERVSSVDQAVTVTDSGKIPIIVGDFKEVAGIIRPQVLVDARMLKRDQGPLIDLAPLVIGLGPGFVAGRNVDAVVETNRGHALGRVIYDGAAEPDTGVPGEICGFAGERVVRSPGTGIFKSKVRLGQMVRKGEVLGTVGEAEPVVAPIDGLLRGLVADGVKTRRGQKIGDVDPRGSRVDPSTISDKGRAIAGGVLEAILHWWTEGGNV